MKRKYSPFEKINSNIVDEIGINNVLEVLKSGFLSRPEGGKWVKTFQKKMGKLFSKRHTFATTSGTSSLHGALAALELGNGDEVLVPALTFIADASTVMQVGAKPVFVDINENDFNIDPEDVLRKINKKTKAMIVVHMFGQPCKMDELMRIAKQKGITLIEDCAQATGAKYKGNPVGSFGDLACSSFYQTKHLVCGEGGVIATNNDKYAEILRSILNNGIKRQNLEDYDFDHIGFNYQMTEIQAALGIRQLQRLARQNAVRRRYAKIYKRILSKTDIVFQEEEENTYNVYCYLSGVLPKALKNKRELFLKMVESSGVPIKKQYPLSLPETEIVRKLGIGNPTKTPVATDISKRIFNLNVNPGLDEEDIAAFAQKVLKAYQEISY